MMNYLKCALLASFLFLFVFGLHASNGITLEGEKTNEGLELTWSVEAQTTSTHFIVEKSKDGINFKTIATLPVNSEISKEVSYTYTDRSDSFARSFYRLVEIGAENQNVFSETIVFSEKTNPKFELKKVNAVADEAYTGQVYCAKAGQFNYRVMTNMGEILKNGDIQVQQGNNDFAIELDGVAIGSYVVALKLENDIELFRLKKVASPELPSDNFAKKQ